MYTYSNMHGLALQQVQALRAVCLLFSPLLFMTAVLAMGTLGGWIFRVTVASTSTSVVSTDTSSSLPPLMVTSYPCAVLSYAFGLASPACFDIANSEEQQQLLLNVAHSTTINNNKNMFLHLHSAMATNDALAQNTVDQQQQHQYAALLSPSLFSLLVGVICPCILFLLLQYQIWRGELRLEDEFLGLWGTGSRSGHDSSSDGIKNEKHRGQILEIRLRDYTHAVQASDVIRPPCSRSRTNACWECVAGDGDTRSICVGDIVAPEQHDFRSCGECCQSVVLVPKPGQRSAAGGGGGTCDNDPKREVPNLCCICLTDYQSGQEIAWSSNGSCRHVFHKSCLMPWLIKTLQCPVCRQSFLVSRVH